MKLRIHHRTLYRYRKPVGLLPHRLVLIPRSGPELTVLACRLDCDPPADISWSQDVYGNTIAVAVFARPADTLSIVSDILVEQKAPAWPVFRIATHAHAYPFRYVEADARALGALREPRHADPDGQLRALARGFMLGERTDTLSLLKDVNVGVRSRVAYRTRDEENTQTPLLTLTLASGSCRDIAALFIDLVAHLGFAARAVTGYLFDPTASVGDPGSTHAWAEVYLPGAGWIAFDPTHGAVGAAHLVPTAVGWRNQEIMPVTGSFAGAPDDYLDLDVTVEVTPQ